MDSIPSIHLRKEAIMPSLYSHAPLQGNVSKMRPEELYDELTALAPIVWLPVSRRLPVTDYEEGTASKDNAFGISRPTSP